MAAWTEVHWEPTMAVWRADLTVDKSVVAMVEMRAVNWDCWRAG